MLHLQSHQHCGQVFSPFVQTLCPLCHLAEYTGTSRLLFLTLQQLFFLNSFSIFFSPFIDPFDCFIHLLPTHSTDSTSLSLQYILTADTILASGTLCQSLLYLFHLMDLVVTARCITAALLKLWPDDSLRCCYFSSPCTSNWPRSPEGPALSDLI